MNINKLYTKHYRNKITKAKFKCLIKFKEITGIIFVYLTICSQKFSIIFYLCVLSVISRTPTLFYQKYLLSCWALSAGAAEYTDCISAEGYKPRPMSILDTTQDNLIVRSQ